MTEDDRPSLHVEAGITAGTQVIRELLHQALDGHDALRDAVRRVPEGAARWALVLMSWWDERLPPRGVRFTSDDPVLDKLRQTAARGSFAAVHAAVVAVPEPDARAALANLA